MRHHKPISPEAERFALFIRRIRKEAGDSQGSIADLIETSRTVYAKKERGIISFSLDEALIIMDYYRVGIAPDGTPYLADSLKDGTQLDRPLVEMVPKLSEVQTNIKSAISILEDLVTNERERGQNSQ